jgi:putative ABC transport system substrate-binding protein
MNAGSSKGLGRLAVAFSQGLSESGFVENQNITIEYHWAEGHVEQLPAMAADLVRRHVSVIAATGTQAALAALRLQFPLFLKLPVTRLPLASSEA